MLLILIVVLMSSLSFEFFMISNRLSSVNRIFVNTPKELFVVSIPLYDHEQIEGLYFDKQALEERVKYYYESTIKKYVESYKTTFYYFNPIDKSMCLSSYCSCVDVELNAYLGLNVNYKKTLTYQIVKGATYGN